MSSSSECSDFAVQKPAKSPDKTSFSQTCTLLSQYIKEKGNLVDLSLGMTCNKTVGNGSSDMYHQTTTMNLFPVLEKSGNVSAGNNIAVTSWNSMSPAVNFLPQQHAAFGPFNSKEDIRKPANSVSSTNKSVTKNSKSAQMTIFYCGQVIVFDDVRPEKAKEIMLFAGGSRSLNQNSFPPPLPQSQAAFAPNLARSSIHSGCPIPRTCNNKIQEQQMQQPSGTIVCDLPLQRKASLHRFLEKRKDRIAARAPYQTSNSFSGPYQLDDHSKSWLGLGAQPSQ